MKVTSFDPERMPEILGMLTDMLGSLHPGEEASTSELVGRLMDRPNTPDEVLQTLSALRADEFAMMDLDGALAKEAKKNGTVLDKSAYDDMVVGLPHHIPFRIRCMPSRQGLAENEATQVARILIKGASGFCSVREAYTDKVTLTPESLVYEYKPYEESEVNRPAKWSYRTTSPRFKELFREIAREVCVILCQKDEMGVTDIAPTTFVVTFNDKFRKKREFYFPEGGFDKCLSLVRTMVPGLEEMPKVLSA